jgi:hypothetical protein
LGPPNSRELCGIAVREKAFVKEESRREGAGVSCCFASELGIYPSSDMLCVLQSVVVPEWVSIVVLQSFYYDGTPMMSNEEFDLLKEELLWQGSKIAVLE